MPFVARLGDTTMGSCLVHGGGISGVITSGSPTVTVNDLPVARLTDSVLASCGHVAQIVSSSVTVTANGLGVARVGDAVGASPYTATIITGSADTTSG